MRKIQRKLENGEGWEDVKLKELTKGDIFRMFEPDGSPVKDELGATEFITAGEPYEVTHLYERAPDMVKEGEVVWAVQTVANPGF